MSKLLILFLLIGNYSFAQTTLRGDRHIETDNFQWDTINNSPNQIFNSKIKLDAISESKAKIDIRLYKKHGLSNTDNLRRIYMLKTIWYCNEFNELNSPPKINKYKLKIKTSFDSLLIKLLSYNITRLPNQSDLKGQMRKDVQIMKDGTSTSKQIISMDGNSYTIEIKIGSKFRVYQFDNPETYAKYYDNISEYSDYLGIIKTFDNYLQRK